MRSVIASVLSAVAIFLALATSAQASPTGQQVFVNFGKTTSNTGNVGTATIFTFSMMITTVAPSDQTGVFSGMTLQTFSPITLNLTDPTSVTFSSPVFGSFSSTSITLESQNTSGLVALINGEWTAGTIAGGDAGQTFPAQFTISLSQTPPTAGLLSGSATFSTPSHAGVVPEPSSVALVFSGLALGALIYGFRRRRIGGRQFSIA